MSAESQVGLRFRVVGRDGREETLTVDAERALVGSAPHCEVRLSPEIAVHEHVDVYASGGVVHVTTRALGPGAHVPLLGGAPLLEGQWPKGAVLSLGAVKLQVELVDMAPPKAKPPLWALFAIAPLAAVAVTAFLLARGARRAEVEIPEAPELLPPKESATCPQVPADQKSAVAGEKLKLALVKRERSPFWAPDGIEAVALFDAASSCYRGAGLQAEAAQADRSGDALRGKIDQDYRLRRLRLEHAFRLRDAGAAKRELAVLIPMTSHRRGPYTEWLAAMDRAATAALDQRGRLAP